MVKGGGHEADHLLLGLGQIPAAAGGGIVLILPCRAADDDERLVRHGTGIGDEPLGERHLLLRPGLLCPALPFIERMLLNIVCIHTGKRLVDPDAGNGAQAVENIRHIGNVNEPAGAGTALAVLGLPAPEDGNGVSCPEGKRPLAVFEQDHTVCRRLARHLGEAGDRCLRQVAEAITGDLICAINHTVLLLREDTHSNRVKYTMPSPLFQAKKHRNPVLFL